MNERQKRVLAKIIYFGDLFLAGLLTALIFESWPLVGVGIVAALFLIALILFVALVRRRIRSLEERCATYRAAAFDLPFYEGV